jgi:hypothetical protein
MTANPAAHPPHAEPARTEFHWRSRDEQEIPEEISVLVSTTEFACVIIASSSDGYLFDAEGRTLDWELVRWWAHIPATPDEEVR